MAQSVEAIVNADMLLWARNSAGFDLDVAAKKIGVSSERLTQWEEGVNRPTIRQLFTLSNVYKRPPTSFYLQQVPKEPTLKYKTDYRRLPGIANAKKSPELILALRRAEYRRKISIELYEELDLKTPKVPFLLNIHDNVEIAAQTVRNFLNLDFETHSNNWRTSNDAFNGWRKAIEESGILVFQVSRIDILEMRAISIDERPLPYILINSADAVNGRIFSLLHELCHIVLSDSLKTDSSISAEQQTVERFCNAVASAILMPFELVATILNKHSQDDLHDIDLIVKYSMELNVSREAFIRRLVTLNFFNEFFYRKMRLQFEKERIKAKEDGRSNSGGPKFHVQVVNSAGFLFSQLVLSSLSQGKITAKDASSFFGASAKHLHNIETLVNRRSITIRDAI